MSSLDIHRNQYAVESVENKAIKKFIQAFYLSKIELAKPFLKIYFFNEVIKAEVLQSINSIKPTLDSFFGAAHGWGWCKKTSLPKICHTYLK